MTSPTQNIFDAMPKSLPDEEFVDLLSRPGVRIERIVSRGHVTPEGKWYDQSEGEWVMVSLADETPLAPCDAWPEDLDVATAIDNVQQAVDVGEFDFLRVLTARRAYFEANLKYVTALTDLAQANAQIEGLLLTGGLNDIESPGVSSGLRGAALTGQ